jgi:hypothetical protein
MQAALTKEAANASACDVMCERTRNMRRGRAIRVKRPVVTFHTSPTASQRQSHVRTRAPALALVSIFTSAVL